MDKKVLVVDLDGTLYDTNTFHRFLSFLLKDFLIRARVFCFLSLLIVLFQRLFRLISHSKMKYRVLTLIYNRKIDASRFVNSLDNYKVDIKELSNPSFDIKILATAAPSLYAKVIAKRHHFDVCLATDFPENGFTSNFENLGEQKKIRLLKCLKAKGLPSVNTFITDHEDDIPILKMAKNTIIINPKAKFSNWLKENLVNFEIRKIE